MLKRIASGTGTALSYLLTQVKRYPKATIVVVGFLTVVGFAFWRLGQPFDPLQPTFSKLGLVALLIGGGSLLLENRDPQGVRPKAVLMSVTAILIGLTLGYLGIRPV